MGQKAGLSLEDVVDAAVEIADTNGLEAATLSAVARRLGIKTPSLYNHVDGLDGLRRQIAFRGSEILLKEFGDALGSRTGSTALRAVAEVDRRFAVEHPGIYESFLPAPAETEDPELYSAMAAPVFLIAGVLLDMGIPQEEAIHLIRVLRATLHGFIDLEAKRGFGMPLEIDESFQVAMDLVIDAIEARARAYRRE